jgi:hypothetical protein
MREQLAPFFHKPEKKWAPMQKIMQVGYSYMRKAMDCDKVVRDLSNYIEGQLEPPLRAEIERHLRRCSYCAILIDSTRKLLYLVGDEKIFVPPFLGNQDLPRLLTLAEGIRNS